MKAIAFACVAIGCANNVPQDRTTGPDGRLKGAKLLKVENGEAKDRGVVTYPGGDRVDWKLIQLPEGKEGQLAVEMKWTPPRPGLQLNFDLFDEWQNPIAYAKGRGRSRDARIPDAKGKYFVRVYAKGRGDAGAYQLGVAFKETHKPPPTGPIVVPDPPRLPSVPGRACETFDAADPECRSTCPLNAVGAPPFWQACIDIGAQQPRPEAPKPPPPPPLPDPIRKRIVKADVQGGETVIFIPAGSVNGVSTSWTGQVMRGDSDAPIPGGTFKIYRVDKSLSYGKVKLTTDTVTANPYVVLKPAP